MIDIVRQAPSAAPAGSPQPVEVRGAIADELDPQRGTQLGAYLQACLGLAGSAVLSTHEAKGEQVWLREGALGERGAITSSNRLHSLPPANQITPISPCIHLEALTLQMPRQNVNDARWLLGRNFS